MNNFYKMDADDIIKNLNSSMDGLSSSEASLRLSKYGRNELPKQKNDNVFKIILREICNPITLILVFTVFFSFLIKEYTDAIIIIFIIVMDLILGVIQEVKAIRNADSLANMIKENAKVIRNGNEIIIDASEVVPGDIVLLESGDKVSADMRIIKCYNFQVDESILTGESMAVLKNNGNILEDTLLADRKNMVYAGTLVVTGRAQAIVIETGINTEIGKICDKVMETKLEKSPLTIRINKFSNQISILIIIIGIIIALILFMKGYEINNIFLLVISLSISAMPEGLPLALTMALTIGANRMAKKNVIVKRLNSVESLGSCTVIVTDKTGTLTVNEQTAKKIVLPDNSFYEISGSGYNDIGSITGVEDNGKFISYICSLGVINNEAFLDEKDGMWDSFGDSIDIAFLSLGKKANVNVCNYDVIYKIPYESVNKYSGVIYKKDNLVRCTVKGSIEKICSFCNTMGEDKRTINEEALLIQNENLAKEGYRIIAIADGIIDECDKYSEDNIKKLNFVGLVAFIDPVRDGVKKSCTEAMKAGIKVVMVTGDHPLTAYTVAHELGLVNNYDEVTTDMEIDEYLSMGEVAFDNFVASKKVFSRVSPLNKLEIVNSFKRQGEFVAVTGDGVNDAPAIKSANIGIAMGSGTDTSKDTAMMIITDDNFTSIVSGIKEGRTAYSNIRKIVYMLVSCGIAEVVFFLLSIIKDMPIPLLAIQLLWLNLVTDGLQDLALSFEPYEKNIMKEKPRSTKESLFNRELLMEIIISGLFIGLLVFITFYVCINKFNMELYLARGYIMTLMVFIQNVHVLNCRSESESTFKVPLRNPLLILSLVGSISLQILVVTVPIIANFFGVSVLAIKDIIMLFILSISILLLMEIYKVVKRIFIKK